MDRMCLLFVCWCWENELLQQRQEQRASRNKKKWGDVVVLVHGEKQEEMDRQRDRQT